MTRFLIKHSIDDKMIAVSGHLQTVVLMATTDPFVFPFSPLT